MVKIDYNLVYLRSENSRNSLKSLSQKVKKSIQRIKYTIAVLEKEGILRNPYSIFDYSYFGLILFRSYFRVSYLNEQDKAELIKELQTNPYVMSIVELTGEFDLEVEFACPNPSRFNKEFKKVIDSKKVLSDYKIILNIVTHIYPKHYLVKDQTMRNPHIEKIIGGDRERESFNKNELIVMKCLLFNPTMRFTQLAKEADLNVKTVKSVLNNLTKRKVIRGFRYVLDTNKLGINKSRIFLKLHNLGIEKESKFMEHLSSINEVVEVNKTTGDWDIEIDIESFDKNNVRKTIMQLREKFKDIIERFNMIEVYSYHKKSYLPLYVFKEEPNEAKNL